MLLLISKRYNFLILTRGYVYWFQRERGRGKERERMGGEREKHQSIAAPTYRDWDPTYHLSMCPDRESNLQPFGVPDTAPTNQTTWLGKDTKFL